MPDALQISAVCDAGQIAAAARLAREIWYEYYVSLIGRAQVDYMLERFQTARAIGEQISRGYEYFLVERSDTPIGYFAVRADAAERRLFISKLYLHASSRGAGTGRRCMEFIEQLASRRGLPVLWLTVNKGNPSVAAYQRLGFRIAAEIEIDIGGGFLMDDYRMEKQVAACIPEPRGVDSRP